ncbi:NUDIX hydrolase [Paenibacillus sp.]|uniref:NUDIX hydrolase n=1 Tax=Paenibacillus sp. TaxID=58172 RepID=UPI0028115CF4|nr:NUDIX hydrolase [Paenibacillus sp.]
MSQWVGAAAVCVDADNRLLMVLQGKPEEEKRWSVPSGGIEPGETLEQCCMREVFEETGYRCKVVKKINEKAGSHGAVEYHVTYFEAEILGGTPTIQDPDGLIYDIDWKNAEQLKALPLSFPEDREFLLHELEAPCREKN